MLKTILFAVAGVIVILTVMIAVRPASYSVTRSATIAAPPDVVFGMVNDFHRWQAWSPWATIDPAIKETYSGAVSGTGAVYSWVGNDAAGEGRMTITDSRPNQMVKIDLQFLKPIESQAVTEFALKPAAGGTAVDWTMSGENNFMAKAFDLFVGMDRQIGGDFEKGLAQMKAVAEKR